MAPHIGTHGHLARCGVGEDCDFSKTIVHDGRRIVWIIWIVRIVRIIGIIGVVWIVRIIGVVWIIRIIRIVRIVGQNVEFQGGDAITVGDTQTIENEHIGTRFHTFFKNGVPISIGEVALVYGNHVEIIIGLGDDDGSAFVAADIAVGVVRGHIENPFGDITRVVEGVDSHGHGVIVGREPDAGLSAVARGGRQDDIAAIGADAGGFSTGNIFRSEEAVINQCNIASCTVGTVFAVATVTAVAASTAITAVASITRIKIGNISATATSTTYATGTANAASTTITLMADSNGTIINKRS